MKIVRIQNPSADIKCHQTSHGPAVVRVYVAACVTDLCAKCVADVSQQIRDAAGPPA